MRQRWDHAPGWLLALVWGAAPGVVALLVVGLSGRGWDTAVVAGAATGGFVGITLGPWARRVRARVAAERSALAAGAPESQRGDEGPEERRSSPALLLVLTAGSVFVALTGSAWWFALTGFFLLLIGMQRAQRRQVGRQVERQMTGRPLARR